MFCSALSLKLSLQSETGRQVLPGCSPVCPGVEGSLALPNPDVPVVYTHFHFERMFPFWASDQIDSNLHDRKWKYVAPKRQDPQNPSPKHGGYLALPPATSHHALGKGSHSPRHRGERLLRLVLAWRKTRHPPSAGWRQCSPLILM